MKAHNKLFFRRLASLFFIVAIALNINLFNTLMDSFIRLNSTDFAAAAMTITLISLMLLLNSLSAVGLAFNKRWAIIIAIGSIIYTWIFFSYNYMPFVYYLFAERAHDIMVVVCNLLLIFGLTVIRR